MELSNYSQHWHSINEQLLGTVVVVVEVEVEDTLFVKKFVNTDECADDAVERFSLSHPLQLQWWWWCLTHFASLRASKWANMTKKVKAIGKNMLLNIFVTFVSVVANKIRKEKNNNWTRLLHLYSCKTIIYRTNIMFTFKIFLTRLSHLHVKTCKIILPD